MPQNTFYVSIGLGNCFYHIILNTLAPEQNVHVEWLISFDFF